MMGRIYVYNVHTGSNGCDCDGCNWQQQTMFNNCVNQWAIVG